MSTAFFSDKQRSWGVLLILAAVCLSTYWTSLHNDFMIDDHGIFNDPKIQNIQFLPYLFIPDKSTVLRIDSNSMDTYYRPLQNLLLMLSHLAFGNQPFYYHLLNLFLLVACCFTLYLFINFVFDNFVLAFLTSLLFAVHPVNSLIVNYITANIFAFQVICMLLSLWTLWLAQIRPRPLFFYFLSLLFFVMSLLCHETGMVLPFYVILMLYYRKEKNWRDIAIKSLPYFLVLIAYFTLRLHYSSLKVSIFDKIGQLEMTFIEFLATFAKLIFWYLSKLFTLTGIPMKWATAVVREGAFIWILGVFCLIGLGVWAIYYQKRLFFISLMWLLLGFIPVIFACFFESYLGLVIEPHWLIFSSIGFFLLLAMCLQHLQNKLPKRLFLTIVLFIILSWGMTSRYYNWLWSDEIRYCQFWIAQAPAFKGAKFHIAENYNRRHQLDKARKYYKEAIENRWGDWQIYNNLGLIDLATGRLKNAEKNFLLALKWNPSSAVTFNNLGTMYLRSGKKEDAQAAFIHSLQLNRFLIEPRLNLATIYETKGKISSALELYKENLKLAPHDSRSLYAMTRIHLEQNEKAEAILVAQESLRYTKDAEALTQLGSLLASHNLPLQALDAYEKAMKINPKFPTAYMEMGKLLGNMDKFNLAIHFWEEGLRLDPQDERFTQLIMEAKKLQQKH